MSKKSWELDRRMFLRGAGVAMALPLLEGMLPRRAFAQAASPTRLFVIKYPLGYHPDAWQTSGTGAAYTVSPQLQKLVTENKNDITLVKGLHTHLNIVSDKQNGLPELNYFSFGLGHYQGTAGFLTCAPQTRGANFPVSIAQSFDQKVGAAVGTQTRFRSLVLRSVENGAGSDAAYGEAKAYRTNISWSTPTSPATSIDDPGALFDKLFSAGVPTVPTGPAGLTAEQRAAKRKVSVLDAVRDDAKRLELKLGKSDQRRLDEYLTGVDEVERLVKASQVPPAQMMAACATPSRPNGQYGYPNNVTARMRAMLDLMILAYQCDLTRVATYLLDEDFQPFNTEVLVPNTLTYPHALSHYRDSEGTAAANKPDQFKLYNKYYFDEYSAFLNKLKAVQTPTGRLIDSMVVAFGSGIGDTHDHQGYDIPMVLAGKGNGAITPGRLVDVRTGAFGAMELTRPWDQSSEQRMKGRPVADLWLTMMRAMGMNDASFGNSTGVISELA